MRDSGSRPPLPAILKQADIFETLGDEEREAVASRMELRRHRAGTSVFREGDPSDGLYVVHSGEVGVVTAAAGTERILARLGRGQCFGEMSLLTGEPRSTGVVATLDTELLFLADGAFDDLIRRYPAVALAIGRTLSLRLRRANVAARDPVRERIIFCFCAAPRVETASFTTGLARSLAACRRGEILVICLGRGPEAPTPDVSVDDLAKALRAGQAPPLASWASLLEPGVRSLSLSVTESDWDPRLLGRLLGLAVNQCRGIVVSADLATVAASGDGSGRIQFLSQALRQADAALLLVDGSAQSLDMARGMEIQPSGDGGEETAPWRVVLLRPETVAPGTIVQVEDRLGLPVSYQAVTGNGASLDRLARRLSRAAVGVALGGGGARGLAHIGILDVLMQEGIPVDVLGGTSMGSIISSLFAVGMSATEVTRTVRREWVQRNPLNDYTFPAVGLIRGRRAERVLRRVVGEVHIEDLHRPYFAVAADLVAAEEVVMSRGPLWQAVRASGSIPILLLPVKIDGRFLVDGGIINNVPGDLLGRFGADISVAVDVTLRREAYFERLHDRERKVGLVGRMMRRVGFLSEWVEYPSILRTLRRVIDIEGIEIMKTKSATFDTCIRPAVAGFDILDFSRLDELIDVGRAAAAEAVPLIRSRMEETARKAATERENA